jgi:hypothetical protein
VKRSKGNLRLAADADKKLTPRAHREQAARLEQRIAKLEQKLREQIAELQRQAAAHSEAAKILEAAKPLPRRNPLRTLQPVDGRAEHGVRFADADDSSWRTGAPLLSDHPFPAALAERKMTVPEWAKAHGLSEGKARSWYRAQQPRRIPRKYALIIQRELGLPADETTWPNGIKG